VVPGLHELTRDTTIITGRHDPFRVGLTGGIASGKSAVARFFEDQGVDVVDTDVIAREVVQPGSPGLDAVRNEFGDEVIAADGGLDRRRMRTIVFADDRKRARLESILHPLIRERTLVRADEAAGPYVVIVVPLLYESPLRDSMDRILVVDCSVETQLRRLLARDGETEESARRIIAAQATREQRLSIADDVVDNVQDLSETARRVSELHRRYLALARGTG